MKRLIFAIVLVLAFCADSFALNLRPYMQTPPEVQVFAKRVIEDGGKVVDLEFCQKYTRLSKQLIVWSNGKFVGDANMGVKLNSGVSVQTLYDLSGNNNDATSGVTVNNQPVWTKNMQGGKYGLVFDGTDDSLAVPSDASTRPNALTLVSYLKVTTYANTPEVSGIRSGSYDGYHIFVSNTGIVNFLVAESNAAWKLILLSDAAISTEFFLSTGSYVSGDGSLYINGIKQVSTSSATGNPYYVSTPFKVGSCGSVNRFLTGAMGGSVLFNTALTTAQRTALETFIGHSYYAIY